MAEIFGGVETGGTWCVCAAGTGPEDLMALERFPTGSPEETLERIVAFFRRGPTPTAVGIGSFGPADLDPSSATWGTVTSTPKPGWQDVAVAPVVAERLGVPVAFDTDVNAAALGEQRWGAGRGLDSLCYLTVGTGVGAGLIVAGHTLRGLIHPEVGHMRIPHDLARDPFPGSCPRHGDCWEGLASGAAMAARWQMPAQDLPEDHPAWLLEADYLAAGILNIVSVASPRRVIAGGGVMAHGGLLGLVSDRLRQLVGGYLRTPLLSERIEEYLVRPQLGDRAGVLGAIALAQTAR
ncbi:MAG TPA: ROK family protein [Solirubrobacteraceae bacterium]|nr:ROK family protein [Solirubrobacteraceae bacterium]